MEKSWLYYLRTLNKQTNNINLGIQVEESFYGNKTAKCGK